LLYTASATLFLLAETRILQNFTRLKKPLEKEGELAQKVAQPRKRQIGGFIGKFDDLFFHPHFSQNLVCLLSWDWRRKFPPFPLLDLAEPTDKTN
jgi:hypothetical protein